MYHLTKPKLLLPAFLLTASVIAHGDSGISLNPLANYFVPDEIYEVSADLSASLGLGYRFNSPWALELTYLVLESQMRDENTPVDLSHLRLDASYYFEAPYALSPYLSVGAGHQIISAHARDIDNSVLNAGFGALWAFNDRVSLRGEFRTLYDSDYNLSNYTFGIGLSFSLGRSEASRNAANEALMRLDSDDDGVRDRSDRCPSTALGASIDAYGCEMPNEGGSAP